MCSLRLLAGVLGAVLGAVLVAPVLLVSPAATAVPVAPFTLAGTVSDVAVEADEPGLDGVAVSVMTVGGGATVATGTTHTDADGTVGFYGVAVPAGGYWLRFDLAGYAPTYLADDDGEGPVTVTVGPSGAVSAPGIELDDDGWLPDVSLLHAAPTPRQAPRLSGDAAVGETLTLDPGTWSGVAVDPDYLTVEWFLDGEPADDFSDGDWWQRFEVPLAAVGARIGYRLTVDDPDGVRAPAVHEGSSAVVPKVPSSVSATVRKARLSAFVSVPGVPKPSGSVTVKDGRRKVGGAKLVARRKGRVVVRLRRLEPGRHRLTVTYAGTSEVRASSTVVRVRVATR